MAANMTDRKSKAQCFEGAYLSAAPVPRVEASVDLTGKRAAQHTNQTENHRQPFDYTNKIGSSQ